MISCTASLSKGLQDYKKANVIIGVCDGEGTKRMLSQYNTFIIDFSKKDLFSLIRNYRTISKVIKKNDIEVIHAQNRIPALYAAVYCFFHKKQKYIWSNHLVPIPSDFFYRITTRYGFCAAAEGISGKEMLINQFKIPKEKVEIVNLGSDINSFTKTMIEEQTKLKVKYGIEADEKVVFLYGRLAAVKGHLFLLDALKDFKEKKFRLIFPGEGEEYRKSIVRKAEILGLSDKLIFPGYVDGREYLSISDLMVLPSAQEGFGIVNVESFCVGVPVIRTTTGGYEDMADCCFGINYGDVNALSELLGKFFAGDTIFKEKAKYAKAQVDRFSLEHMTNQYYSIYCNSLKNGG